MTTTEASFTYCYKCQGTGGIGSSAICYDCMGTGRIKSGGAIVAPKARFAACESNTVLRRGGVRTTYYVHDGANDIKVRDCKTLREAMQVAEIMNYEASKVTP